MRVYTDASSRGIRSGIAYIATDKHHNVIQKSGVVIDQGDNNTAELQAIIYAIDDTQPLLQKNEAVMIFTDSTYAISAIRNNTYRDHEEALVKKIQNLMEYAQYKLFWIKGHCQDGTILSYYNKKVDKLAKGVRVEQEKEIIKQKRVQNLIKQGKGRKNE